MGSFNAQGMAEQVAQGHASYRSVLSWHLTSNHYPPLPVAFIPTCEAVIEALNDQDGDRLITLPTGIEWKDGTREVEAHVLADSFHLWDFVNYTDDEGVEFDDSDFEEENAVAYKIVRFYRDFNHPNHRQVIRTGLTLDEAQAHCSDDSTHGVDDDGDVEWFDGYEAE